MKEIPELLEKDIEKDAGKQHQKPKDGR